MSTTEPAFATAAPSTDAHLQYRALSMSAVSALALTILSLPALFFPALLVLAFVAALVGLFAWIRTSRRREELVGLPLARAAFVVSTLIFVSGTAWSSYEYATEVPEGYRRIGWQECSGANPPISHLARW